MATSIVLNADVIYRAAELTHAADRLDICREARVDAKSVELWSYSQYVLAGRYERPCRCTCEPTVLAFAVSRSVFARDHLAVTIWLCAVDVADVLKEHRVGLAEYIECAITVAKHRLCYDYPRIAVAEYAGIFFISRWVRCYLAELQMIFRVSRLKHHHSILCFKMFLYTAEGLLGFARLKSDARHHAHALRLDEYLAFLALFAADRRAERVISSSEPFSVPSGVKHRGFHLFCILQNFLRFLLATDVRQ